MQALHDQIRDLEEQLAAKKREIVELRLKIPAVAVQDYELKRSSGAPVRLSELFGEHDELIVIHNMGQSCRYCTLWADGISGFVPHLHPRVNMVLSSPDGPEQLKAFALWKGWKFDLVSTEGSTFIADMGFYTEESGYYPGFSSFRKLEDGSIERFSYAHFGPYDDFCGVWSFLPLLPHGENNWEPLSTKIGE